MIPSHKIIGFVTLFWTPLVGALVAVFAFGWSFSQIGVEVAPEPRIAAVVQEQKKVDTQPTLQETEQQRLERILENLKQEKRKAELARHKVESRSKMTFTGAMRQLSEIQLRRDVRTRTRNSIRSTSSFGLTDPTTEDAIGPHYRPIEVAKHVVSEVPIIDENGPMGLRSRRQVMVR